MWYNIIWIVAILVILGLGVKMFFEAKPTGGNGGNGSSGGDTGTGKDDNSDTKFTP